MHLTHQTLHLGATLTHTGREHKPINSGRACSATSDHPSVVASWSFRSLSAVQHELLSLHLFHCICSICMGCWTYSVAVSAMTVWTGKRCSVRVSVVPEWLFVSCKCHCAYSACMKYSLDLFIHLMYLNGLLQLHASRNLLFRLHEGMRPDLLSYMQILQLGLHTLL